MPRFVILEHDHPYWHLDLMLETGSVLQTCRLLAIPKAGTRIQAEIIGEHRRAYLDYEGPVSGGRGSVKRWDTGTYSFVDSWSDGATIEFKGAKINGRAVLERHAGDDDKWTFLLTQGTDTGRAGSND